MKKYVIRFHEKCTKQVTVLADTPEDAERRILKGDYWKSNAQVIADETSDEIEIESINCIKHY